VTLEHATAHATEVASHPTARGTGLDLALAVREPELHQGQQRGLAREQPRPLAPFDKAPPKQLQPLTVDKQIRSMILMPHQ
jgi:hypothetical protein